MQILITIALIVIAILLFELIIFSHEFGHFITAKLSGVKVNEFALGMGPKIIGFKKGETQYTFRLFPIGGYCAMEGEDEESPEPRAFNNAKIWKRMIIIIAGAVMNIILGIILMFVFVVQADSYTSTTVQAFEPNAYTASCGLEVGDKIVEVNGYSVWNSRDLQFSFATMQCENVDGTSLDIYKQDCTNSACNVYLSILSDNEPDQNTINALYDILADSCSQINIAEDKTTALNLLNDACKKLYESVGITDYDLPVIEEQQERQRYHSSVTVERNGETVVLDDVKFFTYYATQEDKENDKTSFAYDFYVEPIEKNFISVIGQTLSNTASMAKMVWTSLVWLVQGKFGFNDLSGPVGIASAVTKVASQGLETSFLDAVNNILFVMVLITINLGIFNMLPFPALDGGRFLFLLIEGIFRKPIPRKVEQYVNTAGFVLLMLFMIVVTCKDVWQLFTGTLFGG